MKSANIMCTKIKCNYLIFGMQVVQEWVCLSHATIQCSMQFYVIVNDLNVNRFPPTSGLPNIDAIMKWNDETSKSEMQHELSLV